MPDDVTLFDSPEPEPRPPDRTRMDAARRAAGLPDPTTPRAGKVGRMHPATSRTAAELVAPRAGSKRARILDLLYANHSRGDRVGMTAAEIGDALGPSRNECATRLGELREQGWVEYVTPERFPGYPKEWPTGNGNTGLLQVLTERGHAAMTKRG